MHAFSTTDSFRKPVEGITLFLFSVVMCSCKKLFSAVKLRSLKLFLLALYSNKLPVNVPHWRICACALAQPDTILLGAQNGKHSQHIARFVLSDGKIKAKQNSPSSSESGSMVGPPEGNSSLSNVIRWHYHWSPTPVLCLSSWVCPELSVTFSVAPCCLSSERRDKKS